MANVEATVVSQVDLKEAALTKTEYKLGNVAVALFGDGIFRDPPTTAGLFGQIEQKCFGKINMDRVCPRGVVDFEALKEAGVDVVRSLDPKDKAKIIAASAVLKTWVVNQNGKVSGEDRDYCLRTISEGQYVPTYDTAMGVLEQRFGRYDLGQIMQDVAGRGYGNEDLGKLAVAAALLSLNEFIAPDARTEFSMLNSEEIQYCSQLASPREIAQRRGAATEVVQAYCKEQYGFEPQSVYFKHGEQIIKGVATARSADGAMYAITDQKQVWWRTAAGEWHPFVIERKGQIEGEIASFSVARADDLNEEYGHESIETIATTGKKKEKFTDICPVRVADYRTPRADVLQVSPEMLWVAWDAQLARREKETQRKIREIQADTAIVQALDIFDQPTINVKRANGQEDKVVMVARSHNEMSNPNLFRTEVNFQSHPQFYIDKFGRIYMQLMKEKEAGGFTFANLNEEGDGLIAVSQENAAYYDTGFNIAFARHDLVAPNDHYVTFEKAQVKKSRADRDYFVWHRLHFSPADYKGSESETFGVKNDGKVEGYRNLPFVVKEPGEVPTSTMVLPWKPGLGGAIRGVAGLAMRTVMGTESLGQETVKLTDLTKAEEKKKLASRLIQLTAKTKSVYSELMWDIVDGGVEIEAVAPMGYKFEKGKMREVVVMNENSTLGRERHSWKRIMCFARVADPKNPGFDLLFDIDGNVYRRGGARDTQGRYHSALLIPNANLDRLLKP